MCKILAFFAEHKNQKNFLSCNDYFHHGFVCDFARERKIFSRSWLNFLIIVLAISCWQSNTCYTIDSKKKHPFVTTFYAAINQIVGKRYVCTKNFIFFLSTNGYSFLSIHFFSKNTLFDIYLSLLQISCMQQKHNKRKKMDKQQNKSIYLYFFGCWCQRQQRVRTALCEIKIIAKNENSSLKHFFSLALSCVWAHPVSVRVDNFYDGLSVVCSVWFLCSLTGVIVRS